MTRSLAGGVRAPGLKVTSHNVRGLLPSGDAPDKICALVEHWAIHQRADVVLIQETHLSPSSEGRAARQLLQAANHLHVPPYSAHWNSCPTGGRAGVGVLISRRLLESGHLSLANSTFSKDKEGRLLGVRCSWGGHSLALASVYCPSGTSRQQAQRSFLADTVSRWLDCQGSAKIILGGDFNFVLDSSKDRRSPQASEGPPAQSRPPPPGSPLSQHGSK